MSKQPFQMPQPMGHFSGELKRRADSFLESFRRLTNPYDPELSFPAYSLFVHSLELYLKAFLATTDHITKGKIRKYNHRLTELYKECTNRNLPYISDLSLYVAHCEQMTSNQDLKYPSGYTLNFPRPPECIELAENLRDSIHPIVSSAFISAELKFASDTRHLRGRKIVWSD